MEGYIYRYHIYVRALLYTIHTNIYTHTPLVVNLKVDDATKRYNQLIEYGVVIRNRTTQPLCENCLRISVGICEENQSLIRALKSIQ